MIEVTNRISIPKEELRLTASLSTALQKEVTIIIERHSRSETANRERAFERFVELLRAALKQPKVRKKSGPSKAAESKRLEEKRQHRILKRERSRRIPNAE